MKNIQRIYLVNPKEKEEPDFSRSFIETTDELGITTIVTGADQFALYSEKNTPTIELWNNGEKCEIDAHTYFFIRSWRDKAEITSILGYALDYLDVPFLDKEIVLSHSVKNSKVTHFIQLKKHSIRFPNTWLCTKESYSKIKDQVLQTLTLPLVLKTQGGLGDQVWLCKDETTIIDTIARVHEESSKRCPVFILQEYKKNDYDIRAIVYKGDVIASIKRASNDGFYNNVSKGAQAERIELTDEEHDIAIRAANIIGYDIAGVDIVRTSEGPLLFELNKAPDITAFNDAAGFDITRAIVQKLVQNTE